MDLPLPGTPWPTWHCWHPCRPWIWKTTAKGRLPIGEMHVSNHWHLRNVNGDYFTSIIHRWNFIIGTTGVINMPLDTFLHELSINDEQTLKMIMAWFESPCLIQHLPSCRMSEIIIKPHWASCKCTLGIATQARKRRRATACCGKSELAISPGWLKKGSVSHPDDIITLS